jgi:ribosomal protein L1
VLEAVAKSRPSSAKGTFIRSCTLSATMSPPVPVDVRDYLQAA